jgi:hypothetical protein
MTPNPKKKRIELSGHDYALLRKRIYWNQMGRCYKCHRQFPFNEWSLHHKVSVGAGGDDSEENCDGYCVEHHPD